MKKFIPLLLATACTCWLSFISAATDDLSVTVTIPDILFVAWGPNSVSATATTAQIINQQQLTISSSILLHADSSSDTGYTVNVTSTYTDGNYYAVRITASGVSQNDQLPLHFRASTNRYGAPVPTEYGPGLGDGTEVIDASGSEYPYSSTQQRTITLFITGADLYNRAVGGTYTTTLTATITAA